MNQYTLARLQVADVEHAEVGGEVVDEKGSPYLERHLRGQWEAGAGRHEHRLLVQAAADLVADDSIAEAELVADAGAQRGHLAGALHAQGQRRLQVAHQALAHVQVGEVDPTCVHSDLDVTRWHFQRQLNFFYLKTKTERINFTKIVALGWLEGKRIFIWIEFSKH